MVANQATNPDPDAKRRQRAEEILRERASAELEDLSPEDARLLFHELQVHQIELEMQNEELRQAQFEIESMRDQYADLYDFAPVGYLTLEANGLISRANLTSVVMLGRVRSELLKQPFSRFVFKDDQNIYYLHFRRIFETQTPQSFELRLTSSAGSPFHARLDGAIVKDGNENVSQCRIALSDITQQKQADSLRHETESLRDQLMLTIAHEFRTPLTIILTSSAILEKYQRSLSQAQRDERLKKISNQVKHLEEMLDSLTFVVKAKRAYIDYQPTWVDLVAFCTEIIDNLQGMTFPEHALTFTTQGQVSGLYADRDVLDRMLTNLISNAIKYSPHGGKVELHVSGDTEKLVFQISDEGIGIPPEAHQRIFEPFYRAPNAGPAGGIGMGLTIVQESVKLLGGTIECQSALDSGTTFTVRIPVGGTDLRKEG